MRKLIVSLIVILSTVLVASIGWYFFLQDSDIPAGETIKNILPFGASDGDDTSGFAPEGSSTGNEMGETTPFDEFGTPTTDLFRISDTPVAGVVVLKKNAQTMARYVDRATGHIYDADLATLTKTKVTNQTLPKIYEAYFRADGNAILFRSLKDDSDVVENLSLTLTPPKSTSTDALHTVSSASLRGNISSVAVGTGNTLFYALKDTSSIASSAFNGTGAKTLFNSAFNEWRLLVAGNNLVVYTKASASTPGYAYTLNSSGGSLTKILGPFHGLVVNPNPAGNRVLYSYFENNKTRLFVKNLQSGSASEILPATIAEKCVWSTKNSTTFLCGIPTTSPSGTEPDNWYRGLTHFSDYVWRFDTNSETAELLSEPKKDFGIDLDIYEPRLSPDEDYLVFINKSDLSLWTLKLD